MMNEYQAQILSILNREPQVVDMDRGLLTERAIDSLYDLGYVAAYNPGYAIFHEITDSGRAALKAHKQEERQQ